MSLSKVLKDMEFSTDLPLAEAYFRDQPVNHWTAAELAMAVYKRKAPGMYEDRNAQRAKLLGLRDRFYSKLDILKELIVKNEIEPTKTVNLQLIEWLYQFRYDDWSDPRILKEMRPKIVHDT